MGENADHVRRGIAATNARDREAIDAIWTDESLFHSTFAASEGRVFRGKAGIEEYFETLDDAFEHVWAHDEAGRDPAALAPAVAQLEESFKGPAIAEFSCGPRVSSRSARSARRRPSRPTPGRSRRPRCGSPSR